MCRWVGWVGGCVGERASGNSYGSRSVRFDIIDKMRVAVNIIYITCEHRPSYIAI